MATATRDAAVVTRFRVNQGGLNQLFRNPRQPVGLFMANVGRKIAGNGRKLAPRGKGEGPHLADNISSRPVSTRQGIGVQIILGVPHALFVVKGTKPHDIGASIEVAPGVWRFIGRSKPGKTTPGGRGKRHPGTKRNDFMDRAAAQEGLTLKRI